MSDGREGVNVTRGTFELYLMWAEDTDALLEGDELINLITFEGLIGVLSLTYLGILGVDTISGVNPHFLCIVCLFVWARYGSPIFDSVLRRRTNQ